MHITPKILLKGFSKPKSQLAKEGGFNDYGEQRKYDFDALEKKLLGWNKDKYAEGKV